MATDRTFRVRHHECDAYGHLNNTTYLRYMEEVDLGRGEKRGARRIDITFTAPVQFGEEVTVSAVPGSGGCSFEFRRGDEMVAGAAVDYEDPGTIVVPDPTRPAPRVFRDRIRVEWRDVDSSLQASPATLAGFAEDCGVRLCAAYGWPLDRCSAAGFAMVLRRHQIELGTPAAIGDELTITTWASDRSRASAVRHYLIGGGAGLGVARFRSHYVWVNPDSLRPVRIPVDFLADFAPNFAG